MSIVVPSVAAMACLDALLEEIETWVHLYTNDADLGPDTTLADLTQADWPDYEPQEATGWTPALWQTDHAESESDPLVWTYGFNPDSTDVYGYYVTDRRTGDLLWVEANPNGPITLTEPTDEVQVLPRLTLRQDPEPE